MSKRRQEFEKVRKKANAGFVGEPLVIRLVDLDEKHPRSNPMYRSYCILNCGDPDCEEWANCEVLDSNNNEIGYVYHVSECQMEDL